MGKTVELRDIATTRSGDKGANANIGIIAEEPEYYEPIKEQVTEKRMKDFLDNFVEGEVTRYEMPNFDSLNFILEEALDGGAATSVRIDRQGKAMCETILQMEIELDE